MSCALHSIIRKTHVSTDELISVTFTITQTCLRREEPCHVKDILKKRDVLADPLYNNKVVTKLVNNIMLDGKKA